MVLIAIVERVVDKRSRKILGYLCKNDQTVAYCCSDCEDEFTKSTDLEKHMVTHECPLIAENSEEFLPQVQDEEEKLDTSSSEGENLPLKVLSEIEKENQLKQKYQVTPCCVQLYRCSIDDSDPNPDRMSDDGGDLNEETEIMKTPDEPMTDEQSMDMEMAMNEQLKIIEQIDAEPIVPDEIVDHADPISSPPVPVVPPTESNVQTLQSVESTRPPARKGRPPKIYSDMILAVPSKRPKMAARKISVPKKSIKPKTPPSVCYICAKQFKTSFQLEQHHKTHIQRAKSPVFPCNICGQQVKNLKIHKRAHKNEQNNTGDNVSKATKSSEKIETNDSQDDSDELQSMPEKTVENLELVTQTKAVPTIDTEVTREEASSSTDAVFRTVACDKELENASSNEAQTNSSDLIASNSDEPSNVEATTRPVIPSAALAIGPPIIIEEYPADLLNRLITESEPISVNEPSQSTQSAEHSESEENGIEPKEIEDETKTTLPEQQSPDKMFKCGKCKRRFDTEKRVAKHMKKHDKKTNCQHCGKTLATSYLKVHIKLKHSKAAE